MRTRLLLAMVVGVAFLCGCAGVVTTPAERRNTVRRSIDMDMRQLADDWDVLWLVDRQYRLTRWHTR